MPVFEVDLDAVPVPADANHEKEWGLPSLDAPIFIMAPSVVEKKYETSINMEAPKVSHGLSQEEADKRLVRIHLFMPSLCSIYLCCSEHPFVGNALLTM